MIDSVSSFFHFLLNYYLSELSIFLLVKNTNSELENFIAKNPEVHVNYTEVFHVELMHQPARLQD